MCASRCIRSGSAVGDSCCGRRESSWYTLILSSTIPLHSSATCNSAKPAARAGISLAELICWGLTNEEIASRLNLSEHTVKNHVHRHGGNPLSLSNPPIAW
ncbi:MAG: hypothetical protein DMG76_14085 [Acidobacteria bacterium]|nr:MAG: hypothetical protein DMG76_14085 [Acidobacteriota bacterium]